MAKILSNFVKKIPPFKNLYIKIDTLQKKTDKLTADYNELLKMYEELFSKQQKFKKIKRKVHENKKQLNTKYEEIIELIEKKYETVLAKEKKDSIELRNKIENKFFREIQYYYYKGLHPDQYKENLKEWYYRRMGETLNLDNPQTFNEKIQWLKLYDSTEIKTQLTDKYLVRNYITEKIGSQYLIPLLGVYDSFDDIDFDALPLQFVMKTNHSSGWNIVVKNKNTLDREDARNKFNNWLNRNYAYNSGLELHYKNIQPKIVIEQYMANDENELWDYRFFCFSGKAYSVWVDVDSGKPTHRRNIYDLDWHLMPLRVNYPNDEKLNRKPQNLKEMINIAEKLSSGFSMVRVDLYEIAGKIYFGEMTFTPQSGQGKWDPPEYNKIYGDMIELPEHEMPELN